MIKVTIAGFDYAFSTAITGVLDLFSLAGVTWNRIQGLPIAPKFQVKIASLNGEPIQCSNGVQLVAHCRFSDVEDSDLILVPTIAGNIARTLESNKKLVHWIKQEYERGADLASNCTGAFLLAEAGILNHKTATTHWGFSEQFHLQYPKVNLTPEQLITADQNVFCAGGGMAWFDLALHLIGRYCGHEIARETAKAYVIDIGRNNQSAYAMVPGKKYHQDNDILLTQHWMEENFSNPINLDKLAQRFNLTPRTFKRRFKLATNGTPLDYLRALRLKEAKKILETEQCSIESIAHRVGYEDQSSFSRLFKRESGLTPGAYRIKFGR